MRRETVVCDFKTTKQKWVLSFFQCKNIFVQLLHFKSFKLITVLQSNIISCHQRDLLLTFFLLTIFTDEKAKKTLCVLCEKVSGAKRILCNSF